jgi:hypothetical protein
VLNSEQYEQAMPDLARYFAVYFNLRARNPLQNDTHMV